MELRQIQYFCAVVETGSFTKAADACLVSQSAISQQVKALEAELGFELLHRRGRGFDVTPAGELFARSREEGRMMVAGNRGFMPIEMRAKASRSGSAIRRIPLVGQQGQLKSEYYCYWPKDRTNKLIEEFADILAGMFDSSPEP